jgi:cobalt/nickel transport system permease protein
MADALLSPAVGATFWAATLGAIGIASKKLKENLDEKTVPLMGVLGAFVFTAQMINFTIPGTGSSGHLGGGLMLAIVLGPFASFLVMASVLTVQALFFADGGLLALGCNIWNLGIYPCFIAYPLIYKPLTKKNRSNRRILFAALLSAVLGLQIGSFSVVIETLLSGRSELPFGSFLLFMQPVHLAIGIVEGFVTGGVITYIRKARPELLDKIIGPRPVASKPSLKKILLTFFLLTVVTGGALSWFASDYPDGLEWSIEKLYGMTEIPDQEQVISPFLKKVQGKTAILPDYELRKHISATQGEKNTAASLPETRMGASLSGILGAIIVLGVIMLAGIGIRTTRNRK